MHKKAMRMLLASVLACVLACLGTPAYADEADQGVVDAGEVAAQSEVQETALTEQAAGELRLTGTAHVQDIGWMSISPATKITLGTEGECLRLEAFTLNVVDDAGKEIGGISYRSHVQNVGWTGWSKAGEESGSTGLSQRVEAVRIKLDDSLADTYELWYHAHVQNIGWLDWTHDGGLAGSGGQSLRLESLEVVLCKKGTSPYSEGQESFSDRGLALTAHVQDIGWQSEVTGNAVSGGTSGQSKRIEAFMLRRPANDLTGDIAYEAHVQNVGWQGTKRNGEQAGTSGQALRVEAVRAWLTDELADAYDLYYRVHVQNIGWMAWTKNGESAGSEGMSLRMEAIQFVLANKGTTPKLDTSGQATTQAFRSNNILRFSSQAKGASWSGESSQGGVTGTTGRGLSLAALKVRLLDGMDGGVSYAVHHSGSGWSNAASNGAQAGDGSTALDAVRIKLTGEAANNYDIWYRAHVSQLGWMSWACNGADAGSVDMSLGLEALEIEVVEKGGAAPGSTACACALATSGDQELDIMLNAYVRDVTGTDSDALAKAYNDICTYPYTSQNKWPQGDWRTWSIPYAKEMYRNHTGNCYRYASLGCWVARRLGYDAKTVSGEVQAAAGTRDPHSWVEIQEGSQTYIVDFNLAHHYPTRNFFWITYDTAPVYYYK